MQEIRTWPQNDAEWDELFKVRASKSNLDPVDRFWFELDRNSARELIEAGRRSGTLPEVDADAWSELASTLDRRLESHFLDESARATIDPSIVKAFSDIVMRAVGGLPANLSVDTVLLSFACGDSIKTVVIGPKASPAHVVINDADSYFIWFFVEFGLMAIELDIDKTAWENLLRPLLLAAWHFSHRFSLPRPIQALLNPGRPIASTARVAVAESFEEIWLQMNEEPVKTLKECLRRIGSSYRA